MFHGDYENLKSQFQVDKIQKGFMKLLETLWVHTHNHTCSIMPALEIVLSIWLVHYFTYMCSTKLFYCVLQLCVF